MSACLRDGSPYQCQTPGPRRCPWPGEPFWVQLLADGPAPQRCLGYPLQTPFATWLTSASDTSPYSKEEQVRETKRTQQRTQLRNQVHLIFNFYLLKFD